MALRRFFQAFQANAFQGNAFQVNGTTVDRAGDIATPAEIAYARRRDKIHAWLRARRERERFRRWTKLEDVITMALRAPESADPRDAAGKVRGPVGKKPVDLDTLPPSPLADKLEQDAPFQKLPPSLESGQRIAKYATDVRELYKGQLLAKQQAASKTYVRLKAQIEADKRQRPSVRELLQSQPKPNALGTIKSYLDADARSNALPLDALAAFAAQHNQAHAQARQMLAAFR